MIGKIIAVTGVVLLTLLILILDLTLIPNSWITALIAVATLTGFGFTMKELLRK